MSLYSNSVIDNYPLKVYNLGMLSTPARSHTSLNNVVISARIDSGKVSSVVIVLAPPLRFHITKDTSLFLSYVNISRFSFSSPSNSGINLAGCSTFIRVGTFPLKVLTDNCPGMS